MLLSQLPLIAYGKSRILVIAMNPPHERKVKLVSQLMLIGLFAVCATNAVAQLPDQEQGAEPIVERPRFAEKPTAVVPGLKQPQKMPPVYNDPLAALRSAKMIYVKSTSLLVRPPVIEEKLRSRREFAELGLVITRNIDEADVILIVQHDLLTKYVYTAIHKDTDIVFASGKVSSLGGTVAGKVAKRFLKQVIKARATAPKTGS